MRIRPNPLARCSIFAVAAVIFSFPASLAAAGGAPAEWFNDLSSIAAEDWNYDRAAHLLERAGFGGTPEQIETLAAMSPAEAVSSLVNYETIDASHLPKFIESGLFTESMIEQVNEGINFRQGLGLALRGEEVLGTRPNEGGVRPYQPVADVLMYRLHGNRFEWRRAAIWWAERMLITPRPLEEKITLFWHDHFATEDGKVLDYRLLVNQIEMLRANATGNFRDLLLGIAQDPGMLVYLDNRTNVKGNANENFAREILELFSLGVGNYTETDIKEAARAFTGWTNHGPAFVDRSDQHDEGEKTIFGQTGAFGGEDVIDLILAREVCAEYIAGKIYKHFSREQLSPETRKRLAAIFRDSGYEIKPLLEAIFLSRDFYSSASYATQIKAPVHLLISTYRKLGLTELPGTPNFDVLSVSLGQGLGAPPNVAGWDWGRAWINPSTMIERGNAMAYLLFPERAAFQRVSLDPFGTRYRRYKNAPRDVARREKMGGQAIIMGPDGMAMAPSAALINEGPRYDLELSVHNGIRRVAEVVKPLDDAPAAIDLVEMLREAKAETSADAISHFARRFLRAGLSEDDVDLIKSFLEERMGGQQLDLARPDAERTLRQTLHLVLSAPEYQLA